MDSIQKIGKNISLVLTAQVLGSILNFLFFLYTARYLGAEGFGVLSFALALTTIFSIFTDLGLRQLTVREVAKDKSLGKKYLENVIGIKMVLAVAVLAALFLFVNLLNYPDKTKQVVYLISLCIVFNAFSEIFYGIFQAHENMRFESIARILHSALLLAGGSWAIANRLPVLAFAVIYPLVSAIILGYAFIVSSQKFVKPAIEINWDFWKSTIKEALPFGLIGIFGAFLYWIDTVMLSTMRGDTVVGWYSAAHRIFLVFLFIPSAFSVSIFPVMSRFHVSSQNSLKFIYEKYFKYMVILSIPIGIGATLIAERIILLFLGNEYLPSVIAFQILIWSFVLICMGGPFSDLLSSINKQLVLVKIIGVSAISNILLNLALIPKYSYVGASVATVGSLFLVPLSLIIATSKIGYKMPVSKIINPILKATISGLIMAIFISCFKNINLFLLITFSAIIYFGLICLFKGVDKNDLTTLKNLYVRLVKHKTI